MSGKKSMSKHAKNQIRIIMSDGKERSLTVLFEDIAASATWKAKQSIPTAKEAGRFLIRELKCSTRKVSRSEPITLLNGKPGTYSWVETLYCL
jgi:hypothetical protein